MFEHQIQLGISHTGQNGQLKLGTMTDLLQDAGFFQLDTEEHLTKFFEEQHFGMFLVSRQVVLDRLPTYGENVTVRSWIHDFNRLFGYRSTVILDEQGAYCVRSVEVAPFVNVQTGRPARIPLELLTETQKEAKLEIEELPRKIERPQLAAVREESIPVLAHQIDRYGHMNNARYIELAADYLPNVPKGFRVEYKQPATIGQRLVPMIYQEERRITVFLENESNDVCASVEFQM